MKFVIESGLAMLAALVLPAQSASAQSLDALSSAGEPSSWSLVVAGLAIVVQLARLRI